VGVGSRRPVRRLSSSSRVPVLLVLLEEKTCMIIYYTVS